MLDAIQSYLREHDLDGWLLYNFRELNPIAIAVAGLPHGGSRRWFLWIPAHGEPHWLIQAIEGAMFQDLPAHLQGPQTRYVSWRDVEEMLPALLGKSQGARLRIAMEYSPQNAVPFVSRLDAGAKEWIERITGAEIVTSADLAQLALAVLTPDQLASHRRAAAVVLEIMDAAFGYLATELRAQRVITERQVQEFISGRLAQANMEPMEAIVAVNANAADPHYHPTAQRFAPIRRGDVVLIDLWSREQNRPDDCFADITWTAYCGTETPPAVRQVFDVVAGARDAAVAFIQSRLDAGAGVYGYEVDDVSRDVITRAGYGPQFIHRTGHSLGPTGHYLGVNLDNLETQDRRALLPGLMFTVEPGIYLPELDFDGSGTAKGLGIRSEVNCVMHADRVEVTTLPYQREVRALLA
ncbi:MAG: M24 family metallopeptidase [Litorilinea sp.]